MGWGSIKGGRLSLRSWALGCQVQKFQDITRAGGHMGCRVEAPREPLLSAWVASCVGDASSQPSLWGKGGEASWAPTHLELSKQLFLGGVSWGEGWALGGGPSLL